MHGVWNEFWLVTDPIDGAHHSATLFRNTGLPDCQISQLQRVHNSAARIVSRCSKRDHMTSVLCELHWLPVP